MLAKIIGGIFPIPTEHSINGVATAPAKADKIVEQIISVLIIFFFTMSCVLTQILRKAVTEWYHEVLHEMDSALDVKGELFDVTNLFCVKEIAFNLIMEGLSTA